jgi:hypothetical protein
MTMMRVSFRNLSLNQETLNFKCNSLTISGTSGILSVCKRGLDIVLKRDPNIVLILFPNLRQSGNMQYANDNNRIVVLKVES